MKYWKKFFIILGVLLLLLMIVDTAVRLYYKDKIDFEITRGFDFASGRSFTAKTSVDGKIIWIQFYAEGKESAIMKKYNLGYKEPILNTVQSESYCFSLFNIVTTKQLLGWKKYLWSKPYLCGDGVYIYGRFFDIIEKFSPPENEIKAMYAECIRIYENRKITGNWSNATLKYLQEHYEHYKSDALIGISIFKSSCNPCDNFAGPGTRIKHPRLSS